jgi:hypothetical protein
MHGGAGTAVLYFSNMSHGGGEKVFSEVTAKGQTGVRNGRKFC